MNTKTIFLILVIIGSVMIFSPEYCWKTSFIIVTYYLTVVMMHYCATFLGGLVGYSLKSTSGVAQVQGAILGLLLAIVFGDRMSDPSINLEIIHGQQVIIVLISIITWNNCNNE